MQGDLFRFPRKPWNTGRIIGAKAPLKPKHVWAIRQQLKAARRVRDLRQRSTVIQQKTGRPVPFEITDPTRNALADWLPFAGAGSTIGCFQAAAARVSISARVSMRASWTSG
jgi:hypothetical protein